jgi:plastocyanin
MRLLAVVLVLGTALVVPAAYAATSRPPARLQVTSSEFDFVLSRSKIRQGRAIVQLVNLGEDPHDLALRRIAKGARTYRTKSVRPDGVVNISFRLYPGRYQLWCTIGDHRAQGMRAILTVTK